MDARTYYTDAVLTEMFKDVAFGFEGISKHFAHLEGHIAELAKRPSVIVKAPKGRFVLGVVVGVVAYRTYLKNHHRIDTLIENASEGAKQRFTPPENIENPNRTQN